MTIKRFVAGVVCPKCGLSDVVRVWQQPEEQKQYRECVDCGYQDSLSHAIQVNVATEPDTRIQRKPEVETQTVRFIEPT